MDKVHLSFEGDKSFMSNLRIIGELPDFGEKDTLVFEDGIRRGDIVCFVRKDSETVAIQLVTLNNLSNFVGQGYRVDKESTPNELILQQVEIEQLEEVN